MPWTKFGEDLLLFWPGKFDCSTIQGKHGLVLKNWMNMVVSVMFSHLVGLKYGFIVRFGWIDVDLWGLCVMAE